MDGGSFDPKQKSPKKRKPAKCGCPRLNRLTLLPTDSWICKELLATRLSRIWLVHRPGNRWIVKYRNKWNRSSVKT